MAKILVVDDDLTDLAILQRLLEKEGHEVATAVDGSEGLLLAGEQYPDAIICDWMMPGINGIDFCRKIKANPELAPIFFVLLTARQEAEDLVEGLDAGADEFVSKPIEAQRLLARMRAGLRARNLTQQLSRANQYLAALVEVQGRLLAGDGAWKTYKESLAILGEAMGASRAYLCDRHPGSEGKDKSNDKSKDKSNDKSNGSIEGMRLRAEWHHSTATQGLTVLPSSWLETLGRGDAIHGLPSDFSREERELLESLGIGAILILPLTINGVFFGAIACEKHMEASLWNWSELEFISAVTPAFSLHLERTAAEEEKTQLIASLQESEARYRAIVEDQTELICRFAPDGTITFANNAYCRYFAKTQAQIVEGCLVPGIPDLERDIDRYPVVTRERSIVLANGETRIHQWTDRAIFDPRGQLLGFQAVGQDITDRKQAEEDQLKALKKEKELSELRTRLVAMVSHEFRTPLTTILSAADLLEYYLGKWPIDKQLQYIQRIQVASVNMNELLEDVLFVGRSDANKIPFNPKEIDLYQFCRQLVQEFQETTKGQNPIHFGEHFGTGEACQGGAHPPVACMDEKLLRKILGNLLSNAIKYSPKNGEIHFHLTWGDKKVVFQIQDSGIGIPKDELPHLFESFHRSKNVGTIPGSGLGLAIVKRSVQLHGGQISVQTEVGKGTMFTVTLPLK
ncbi:MAG: response regulator [Oscillatoria sp. SIO1A7]|nr:response regulator [Oscillatoria sp. SIO1A7]